MPPSSLKGSRENEDEHTTLTHAGYAIARDKVSRAVKRELFVCPNTAHGYGGGASGFPCYVEDSRFIYLPKWYGLSNFGAPDRFHIEHGDPIHVRFRGKLRPIQTEAIHTVLSKRSSAGIGGILVLPCGFGKTVCALYLIASIRRKAMVVVHKDFLLKQWKERIEQYLIGAKVGILKAKVCDVEGKDIVLASLQSLSMKEYDASVFQGFGTLVVDEVHHIGAEVFSRALYKTSFMVTVGLSATPNRKDGLTKVIKWFIGPVIFKASRSRNEMTVTVKTIRYRSDSPEYKTSHTMYNGKVNMSKMVTSVCEWYPRTQTIISCIHQTKEEDPSRNILVLSDRRSHLDDIAAGLKQHEGFHVGYYVGGMKEKKLLDTETRCDIILATYSMSAEAMDIPKLDTLLLASPKSDVEQAVGRILRKQGQNALVIDILDPSIDVFASQARKRAAFYRRSGFNFIESTDTKQPILSRRFLESLIKKGGDAC
jgi:superfamily II DNA or RNA helicase